MRESSVDKKIRFGTRRNPYPEGYTVHGRDKPRGHKAKDTKWSVTERDPFTDQPTAWTVIRTKRIYEQVVPDFDQLEPIEPNGPSGKPGLTRSNTRGYTAGYTAKKYE